MVDDTSRDGSSPVENPQLLKEIFISSADPSQKLVPWFSWWSAIFSEDVEHLQAGSVSILQWAHSVH